MKAATWTCLAALALAGCREGARQDAGPPAPAAKAEEHAHGAGDGHAGHEHGEEHDEVVALAPEAVRAARIEVARAERRPLGGALEVPARVMFPQRGVARVSARVAGLLDDVKVEVGQRVRKGAVLAIVESPELGRARAEFLAAATKARVAEGSYRREKELLAKGISSEREAREAESALAVARAELHSAEAHLHALGLTDEELRAFRAEDHPTARFAIRTPIDGTVVEIAATLGQSVDGTAPLFTVGDLSRLWVVAEVYESQLALVRAGAAAEVLVPSAPGRSFRGSVEAVGDVVDEKTRTVAVRIVVPNADRALKPGMFGTARLTGARAPAAEGAGVVVPRDAVQRLGDRTVVFVPEGEGRFRPVEVQVGAEGASEVELRDGLDPGDEVVTRGAFTLKSELSKEALSGGHAGHGH